MPEEPKSRRTSNEELAKRLADLTSLVEKLSTTAKEAQTAQDNSDALLTEKAKINKVSIDLSAIAAKKDLEEQTKILREEMASMGEKLDSLKKAGLNGHTGAFIKLLDNVETAVAAWEATPQLLQTAAKVDAMMPMIEELVDLVKYGPTLEKIAKDQKRRWEDREVFDRRFHFQFIRKSFFRGLAFFLGGILTAVGGVVVYSALHFNSPPPTPIPNPTPISTPASPTPSPFVVN